MTQTYSEMPMVATLSVASFQCSWAQLAAQRAVINTEAVQLC